ncbi:MAG: outer membrane protein transport protein [Sulfurospirillaceae bacterium]|nr:outer membrane protein transport protein [Sulfurospirillaceae bacterium]MDD2825441.1 outer membrane protein transport protein [Sulfurospirillaceae bacterium]
MKNVVKVATLLSLSAATLLASGYRIPEQSLNAVAMSAANVAGVNSADASYYNPANMSFIEDGSQIEVGMTYINLPKVSYTDVLPAAIGLNGDSKVEQFLVPTMHYISPFVGNWRYGLSITAPAGLSKRWDEVYGRATAEEFTLKVIEVNPTASYHFNDQLSAGFGLRGVYTDGVVKSTAAVSRDLTGDSIDFGYNLALSYKPIKELTLSSTYRSKVDLTVDGNADLYSGATKVFNNIGASVTIPLPASLALAAAYTIDKTTVEFVFERTYWSAYENLDFNYDQSIGGLAPYFDAARPKNWKDANAYRIGVSHQYSDTLKLMAGFAIDKTPTPDSTLGFELPDSDAKLYSIGFEYKLNKQMAIGLAYLYDAKESRSIDNRVDEANPATGIHGTFTDSAAHLVTASFKYKF